MKLRNRMTINPEVSYDGFKNGLDDATEKTKRSVKRLRMAVCGNMNGKLKLKYANW